MIFFFLKSEIARLISLSLQSMSILTRREIVKLVILEDRGI